jgi:glutathione S-transferase
MKLYSANLSPYASRARLAVYAKELPIEVLSPPGGFKSPEYLAITPIGKVPCLVLDDGVTIPESSTIIEYLEAAFSEKPLLPKGAEAAARVRLLARVGELYVMEPLHHLFDQVDPTQRDQARVDKLMTDLNSGLDHLERYLSGSTYAAGDGLTLADCELIPVLFYVNAMGPAFGDTNLVTSRPKVAAYIQSSAAHPAVAKVLGELGAALKVFMTGGGVT